MDFKGYFNKVLNNTKKQLLRDYKNDKLNIKEYNLKRDFLNKLETKFNSFFNTYNTTDIKSIESILEFNIKIDNNLTDEEKQGMISFISIVKDAYIKKNNNVPVKVEKRDIQKTGVVETDADLRLKKMFREQYKRLKESLQREIDDYKRKSPNSSYVRQLELDMKKQLKETATHINEVYSNYLKNKNTSKDSITFTRKLDSSEDFSKPFKNFDMMFDSFDDYFGRMDKQFEDFDRKIKNLSVNLDNLSDDRFYVIVNEDKGILGNTTFKIGQEDDFREHIYGFKTLDGFKINDKNFCRDSYERHKRNPKQKVFTKKNGKTRVEFFD